MPENNKGDDMEASGGWRWGDSLNPTLQTAAINIPEIYADPCRAVLDIRDAPGGNEFSFTVKLLTADELLILVSAVATDCFSLYLEADRPDRITRGGIHLDSSKRKVGTEPSLHIVRFKLPSNEKRYFPLCSLLPAKACSIEEPGFLKTALKVVAALQKKEDHSYFIRHGAVRHGRLCLYVDHPYPVTGFRLEYQQVKTTPFESPILNAELFSLEDHDSKDCTCARKGSITSTIEFELSEVGLNEDEFGTIQIWGPHDTQIINERILTIFTKNV